MYKMIVLQLFTLGWKAFFEDQIENVYFRRLSHLFKVLSLLEACFDLITLPSVKIQIMGGKITENLGFKSPLLKVKRILSFFFHFQILHNNKTRYQKMVKIKDFCVKNLKMKRGQKFLDLPKRGFEPQIFSNFSAHDLNLNLNS